MRLGKLSICALLCAMVMIVSTSAMAASILVKAGSTGKDVRTVQTLLKEKGFYHNDITGKCDKATVEAIKAYQRFARIEVDGICGFQTYRKLTAPPIPAKFKNARMVMVEATAYSPSSPGMGAHTYSGTILRRGVIAVDPLFIPLGTKVFIPEYGEAIAEDIGASIKGNVIDICFSTHEEALMFGRQTLEILVLDNME